jgi:hypothetical protein
MREDMREVVKRSPCVKRLVYPTKRAYRVAWSIEVASKDAHRVGHRSEGRHSGRGVGLYVVQRGHVLVRLVQIFLQFVPEAVRVVSIRSCGSWPVGREESDISISNVEVHTHYNCTPGGVGEGRRV